MNGSYFRDYIGSLFKVGASSGVRFGKEIFNQSHADVIAHLIELFINLKVVSIVVLT